MPKWPKPGRNASIFIVEDLSRDLRHLVGYFFKGKSCYYLLSIAELHTLCRCVLVYSTGEELLVLDFYL